jgi:hypothetical protein
MKNRRRVDAVQNHLTPLEIVLLDVEEARRLGSLEAFARKLARDDKRSKRVDIIDEMIRNRCRGKDDEQTRQQLREAQKEAMFLHRLAVETWSSVLANERAWSLTAAAIGLLHAMALDMVNGEKEPIEAIAKVITAWHDAARSHLKELETELEAARLIEREYFGGAKILFERDRAMLVEMIGSAESAVNLASDAKRVLDRQVTSDATTEGGAEAGSDEDAIRVLAASLANRRADLARVHVHDRFSEEREAGAILKGVLAVG